LSGPLLTEEQVITPKPQVALLHSDVSYILVGGLGGIGRATALWMADNGARTLIFVNRSGLSSAAAQETAGDLKKKGVCVIVYACDISDSKQVEKMVSELARDAPPIRGVIQSAMVLRVGPSNLRRLSSSETDAPTGYTYRENDH
jgi:NAD(P)-dependent dehydrogenase (short-subunit alcohol dehydrogenase family)